MSSGDELATATAHYGDDFAGAIGLGGYNVGNKLLKALLGQELVRLSS